LLDGVRSARGAERSPPSIRSRASMCHTSGERDRGGLRLDRRARRLGDPRDRRLGSP
jgi:hypothetical protein